MTTDEALAWAELPKDEQALESLRHGDEIGWIELSEEALPVLAAEVRRLREAVERVVDWSMLTARPNKGYGWNTVLANLVAALGPREKS